MTRFMLDSNAVSHILRGHPSASRKAMGAHIHQLCLSAIVEAELRRGLDRRPEATRTRRLAEEFLARTDILPWTTSTAKRFGRLAAKLETMGAHLSLFDILIAAHALEADTVLVTSDRAFRRVPELKVEDWTVA